MITVELYAGILRAVMVTSLADGMRLHSTLGYVSPMTFEAATRSKERSLAKKKKNAA